MLITGGNTPSCELVRKFCVPDGGMQNFETQAIECTTTIPEKKTE